MHTSPSPTTRPVVSMPGARRRRDRQALYDAIPGALAWITLALVIAGAIAAPLALLVAVALLAWYSMLRFALAAAANLYGLHLIRRWERDDWQPPRRQADSSNRIPLEAVHHLVIVPNYNEPVAVLERTLTHLGAQANAGRAMTVVLAMEAAEPGAHHKAAHLAARFAASFAHILVTVHPANLPGEIQCKSANLAWALEHAQRMLIDEWGHVPDHILVTTMDTDTLWHPRHFERLTVLFATDPTRYSTIWQAPLRYHANVWQSHPLLRILHAYASAWELAYLAAPWWRALPMSSYALSLRLLLETRGWDTDAIADEWHMAIKAFFKRRGDLRIEPVYLPFYVQAVTGSSFWAALRARYRQTFRHAWGAQEIGYTLRQIIHHPETPRRKASGLLLRVAHDNLLAGAGWIVLFVGAQLPLLLHPAAMLSHMSSPPVVLLQIAVVIVSALTILFWWLDVRQRPQRSAPATCREWLGELAGLPLVAVLTVIGVALPVLHAQTRLMLGKAIRFHVTPKT